MSEGVFYVYHLIDPRDGEVFYVGKGSGNRPESHTIEAKRGVSSMKCDRIRAILDSGSSVQADIVRRFEDEAEAYSFEAYEITRIGRENLTNIAPGVGGVRQVEMDGDVAWLRLLNNWIVRTDGLKREAGYVLGRQWHKIPLSLLKKDIDSVQEIVKERGVEWCSKHIRRGILEAIQQQRANNAVR